MHKIFLSLLILASPLAAQYSWHTILNSFPPNTDSSQTQPQWIDPASQVSCCAPNAWFSTVGTGDEIRSTVSRAPLSGLWAQTWQVEHYHGWASSLDYNTGNQIWTGYSVTFTRNLIYDGMVDVSICHHQNGYMGVTQLASFSIPFITAGTTLSSSIRRSDGPNGLSSGIYIRAAGNPTILLAFQPYYHRLTGSQIQQAGFQGGFSCENCRYPSSATPPSISAIRVGAIETTPPNNPTSLSSTITTGFSLRRGMRRRMM